MATTDSNIALVTSFCESWASLDLDVIMSYFADDGVWHNIPMDPIAGKEAVRAAIQGFMGPATSVEFEVLAIAAVGDSVLTERIDRFGFPDNNVVLPVAGVFDIRDGLISAWRDYFDLPTYLRQVGLA